MSRLRFVVPLGAYALLVLAIGIKQSPEKDRIPSPLIGKPAPKSPLPSLTDSGRRVSSARLRDHWYLFNVWGTWCGSCRLEHPMLLEIRRTGPVSIIGLDWNETKGDALSFLKAEGDPYQRIAVDRDGSEAIMWGVYAARQRPLS